MTATAEDVAFVCQLVRTESAIMLDGSKQYLIESRLRPLAREAGLETITALVDAIKRGSRELKVNVVEAMTTNETSFFRDSRPFESLNSGVIPLLAQQRAATRTLRVWSAAASSGQEAYSIAMTLREHPALQGWNIKIQGSDIANSVLAQARSGRYAQLEVNRGLPATKLVKWFEKDGLGWVVKPELRQLVKFDQLNLLSQWPATYARFDIVFLRNVLIYFDVETKRKILERMKRAMCDDGYLLLGSAEMMNGIYDGFRSERFGQTGWFRSA